MSKSTHARQPHNQSSNRSRQGTTQDRPVEALEEIKATYNFVPLSKWVHKPDWARKVSHDLPFRDGISGVIEYTITAHQPILVGDQRSVQTDGSTSVLPFLTPDGRYAIPGSSLKGMVRSVMEIATFARMNMVDDQALSIRDLTSRTADIYRKKMSENLGNDTFRARAKAGWLHFENGTWKIKPCRYSRVEHDLLARYSGDKQWYEMPPKPAANKCNDWRLPLRVEFDADTEEKLYEHSHNKRLKYSKVHRLGKGCKQEGTLVFTGQPTKRRRGASGVKHMEFVFWDSADNAIEVPREVMQGFIQVHTRKDGASDDNSSDWNNWKNKERIPVFYLTDAAGNVSSLGLALMYRLPYTLTIHQAIANSTPESPGEHNKTVGPGGKETPDFTTALFGCADPTDGESLKGRVSFSLAVAEKKHDTIERQAVLSSPRPSYFPNYLTQTPDKSSQRLKGERYTTLMDKDATIRGWKRYPARGTLTESTRGNANTLSNLHLLPADTRFRGRIRVHNLKPEELGALMWVLTWGGNSTLRHSIGMGKSLGYGQISITIEEAKLKNVNDETVSWQDAMQCFVRHMEGAHQKAFEKDSWQCSPQIEALLYMADPANDLPLGNMILDPNRGINQFVDAKKNGYILRPATLKEEGKLAKSTPTNRQNSGKPGEPALANPNTATQCAEAAVPSPALTPTVVEWPPLLVEYQKSPLALRVTNAAEKTTAWVRDREAEQILAGLTTDQRNRLEKKKLKAMVRVEKLGNRVRIVTLTPQEPQ